MNFFENLYQTTNNNYMTQDLQKFFEKSNHLLVDKFGLSPLNESTLEYEKAAAGDSWSFMEDLMNKFGRPDDQKNTRLFRRAGATIQDTYNGTSLVLSSTDAGDYVALICGTDGGSAATPIVRRSIPLTGYRSEKLLCYEDLLHVEGDPAKLINVFMPQQNRKKSFLEDNAILTDIFTPANNVPFVPAAGLAANGTIHDATDKAIAVVRGTGYDVQIFTTISGFQKIYSERNTAGDYIRKAEFTRFNSNGSAEGLYDGTIPIFMGGIGLVKPTAAGAGLVATGSSTSGRDFILVCDAKACAAAINNFEFSETMFNFNLPKQDYQLSRKGQFYFESIIFAGGGIADPTKAAAYYII
jgi:hypothetical protein